MLLKKIKCDQVWNVEYFDFRMFKCFLINQVNDLKQEDRMRLLDYNKRKYN